MGEPTKGTTIVDVMDRGADAAEVIAASIENKHEFLIRAKRNRYVKDENYRLLFELGESLPIAGHTTLEVQGKNKRKRRKATLNLSFSKVTIPSPKRKKEIPPRECNLVRIHESCTPMDEEPIEWFLLTSLEVNNIEDAIRIMKYYSFRWVIEEYHKCLKTGFRLEKTQLKTLKAIENLLGFISVSAVKLLQLRDIVRTNPTANVTQYVEEEDINIAKAYYHIQDKHITIDKFLRLIAQMGGFLNRKSDGNPGWQTIWEGWKFFLYLKEGARLYKEGKICG